MRRLLAVAVVLLLLPLPATAVLAQGPGPDTPTFTPTITRTPSNTPGASPTPTLTQTPYSTSTPGPSVTPLGPMEDLADWAYPVCGAIYDRDLNTMFDHYWPEQIVYPTESPLVHPGDGHDTVVFHDRTSCDHFSSDREDPCGKIIVTRSNNRNFTEFQARLDVPDRFPLNAVYAPHAGRVLWVGPSTRLGWEDPSSGYMCQPGGWTLAALLALHDDEYIAVPGLSALFVREGDVVEAGQMIGVGTTAISNDDPATNRTAPIRAMHYRYGHWFDPLGWGPDAGGDYVKVDPGYDPWFQATRVPSQRRIEPLLAHPPNCPMACASGVTVVDSLVPGSGGFECSACYPPVTDPLAYGGAYRFMQPSGVYTQTDTARWTAPAAPGVYAIYASHRWAVDTNGDDYPDTQTSPAARYLIGGEVVTASQKPEGPRTTGWYYLGSYTFSTAPYVELSNASYANEDDPTGDYLGTTSCERLLVDAIMFVRQCGGDQSSDSPVIGTPPPAMTSTPCPDPFCGGFR